MCTLVAIKRRDADYPLVIAANRDEFYARPASPPRVVHERPRAVAGVDLERGGTWMGANERGLFAALTNQRSYLPAARRPASRGRVVLEALARSDVDAVDAFLDGLDPSLYDGFNLMYGDAGALSVAYARPERSDIERVRLGEGVWVLPNDVIGSTDFPKTTRAAELVAPLLGADWDTLSRGLARVLADHVKPDVLPEPPPGSRFDLPLLRELQALCTHTPVYGTRSASILALEPRHVARYLFADGPPCRTSFEDVTALLRERG